MALYYAAATGGFYDSTIHDAMPADAVEITAEVYAALLDAQASGKVIQAGADGQPEAAMPPSPTADALAATIRARRAVLLAACDWTQLADAPLSAEVKATWATYRQALRDITAQAEFPAAVDWPVEPGA